MTVTKKERLSALVDNEADGFEARRLLDELGRNEQDMALWERYHMIGDAVRGGLTHPARPGFADGVMACIAHEVSPAPTVPVSGRRFVRPVAGIAMAASVAVAALVGVVNLTDGRDASAPAVADAGSMPAAVANPAVTRVTESVSALANAPRSAAPADRLEASDARIHSFIVNHAEHAAGQGLMPYVRVVGYESPAQ